MIHIISILNSFLNLGLLLNLNSNLPTEMLHRKCASEFPVAKFFQSIMDFQ